MAVSIGGYIDDEASKQLVVAWGNHQSIVVKIEAEGTYAIGKCEIESNYGLPSTFDSEYVEGRTIYVSNARENTDNSWFCGITASPNMILNYIKHYYTDCDWDAKIVENLIAKKLICAQVCFALSGGGIFFNTSVIDVPHSGINDTTITIDTQLFLALDNIKKDFEVTVTDNKQQTQIVGGDAVKAIETPHYLYEYASLSDYNKIYTGHSQPQEQYSGGNFSKVSVTSPKYQQARVRFFIHPDRKDEVQKVIGDKKIPEGFIGEPKAYYTEAFTSGAGGYFDPGDGSIPYFNPADADGKAINYTNYAKGARIMWFYEVGNANPDSICLAANVSEVPGDGAGLNFGPYQTNREGINSVLQYYCTVVDTTSADSQYLAANWMNKKITAASSRSPELKAKLKSLCTNNPQGVMRACSYAWSKTYYWDTAKRLYRRCGFNSALGLAMCMYIPNQRIRCCWW